MFAAITIALSVRVPHAKQYLDQSDNVLSDKPDDLLGTPSTAYTTLLSVCARVCVLQLRFLCSEYVKRTVKVHQTDSVVRGNV